MADKSEIEGTKRLMGALLRMPPKLHSEMKLGKVKERPTKEGRQKHKSRTQGRLD